jgi:uncharacterized protein
VPSIETARAWYPDNDPVHGFEHILRVYRLAERLAKAVGADLEIVRAAVLLHDAKGEVSSSPEPATLEQPALRVAHHQTSAWFAGEILRAEGWPEERIAAVQHCIRAHRFRDDSEQPETLEAKVLFDADKLDAIGAIGVARAIAYAARQSQPAYAAPSERFLQTGERQQSEPHSAYHEYLFKLRVLKERMHTDAGLALAEERHRFMAAFFERLGAETSGEK